jgi:hypothetical protein
VGKNKMSKIKSFRKYLMLVLFIFLAIVAFSGGKVEAGTGAEAFLCGTNVTNYLSSPPTSDLCVNGFTDPASNCGCTYTATASKVTTSDRDYTWTCTTSSKTYNHNATHCDADSCDRPSPDTCSDDRIPTCDDTVKYGCNHADNVENEKGPSSSYYYSWDCENTYGSTDTVSCGGYFPPAPTCKTPTTCGSSSDTCNNGSAVGDATDSGWTCYPTDNNCSSVSCAGTPTPATTCNLTTLPAGNPISLPLGGAVTFTGTITTASPSPFAIINYGPSGLNETASTTYSGTPGIFDFHFPTTTNPTWNIYTSLGTFNAQVFSVDDIYGDGLTSCGTRSIQVTSPPPALSCTVKPASGTSPLVVKVDALNGTGPYTYTMNYKSQGGSTDIFANQPNDSFYYTYTSSTNQNYVVQVTAGNGTATCTPSVTVGSPYSSNGGEVSP